MTLQRLEKKTGSGKVHTALPVLLKASLSSPQADKQFPWQSGYRLPQVCCHLPPSLAQRKICCMPPTRRK